MYAKNQFCKEIYTKLNDQNCFIQGDKWTKKIISLFVMLSLEYREILEYLANYSCKSSNKSLLQEIDTYFNKNINELQQKIAIINDMRMDSKYEDIAHALMKKQIEMITELEKMKLSKINKSHLKNRIRNIKQTWQHREMQRQKMPLSNLEILSIILYCDDNTFVTKMRQSQREQHLNSCEWRTLFYHLHSAIDKMHKILHYKNKWFYKHYIHKRPSWRNKLFRGIYNRSLNTTKNSSLSLQTVTSFSASFEVAKTFASPRGSIIAVNDAFKSIYYGDLKAADVSWISTWKGEEEFVLLPITFESIISISKTDKNYYECIYDATSIKIYQANIHQFKCDIAVCKHLHRLVLGLYWFTRKYRISSDDNMVIQCVKRSEYLSYQDLNHVAKVHYNEMTGLCFQNRSELIVANMAKYGVDKSHLEFIMEHLISGLKSVDMKKVQQTESSHLDNRAPTVHLESKTIDNGFVTLDASKSTDIDPNATVLFDYGDGSPPISLPNGSLITMRAYSNYGSYRASVTVMDAYGKFHQAFANVNIGKSSQYYCNNQDLTPHILAHYGRRARMRK